MSEENPYAAPTTDFADIAVGESFPRVEDLRIASQGKRFLNMIIDQIAFNAFCAALEVVLALVGGLALLDNIPDLLFFLAMMLFYFIAQEAVFGRTLGKLITGTKVVDLDGNPPSFGQVVGRTFARMIPFEAFSFFGGRGYPVGWHDSLSKTRVVTVR